MMNARLKKLVEDFSRHKNIDALLIINDSNIRYLTQFPACESWLLVTKSKAFYITDSRYVLEARQGLKGVTVIDERNQVVYVLGHLLHLVRPSRLALFLVGFIMGRPASGYPQSQKRTDRNLQLTDVHSANSKMLMI